MIAEALVRTGGNKNRAAELLGLHRTTLVEKLRKYGLQRDDVLQHAWVDNGPGWCAVMLRSAQQVLAVQVDATVLGPVKLVTALFFDLGVYLIVVGLVLDILRSLGARVDVEMART